MMLVDDAIKLKKRGNLQPFALIVLMLLLAIALSACATSEQSSEVKVSQERLELDPYLGNPDAPVTIVEYAAYGCDSCRRWHLAGIVEQLLVEFPNQVKFIYRDMPIIRPSWSQDMAEIAQCALDQGQDAFWLVNDALYEDTALGRTTQSEAVQMAIDLGLDAETLETCVAQNTHYETVRYDMERSEALGIRGTPVWFVNGQIIYEASSERLREMISIELSGLSG